MITVTTHAVPPPLSPFVHFIWKATTQTCGHHPVMMPPNGYVLLTIFISEARYQIKFVNQAHSFVPRAALQGQYVGPLENSTKALHTETLGIAFKPTALHQLWGINMHQLTQKVTDAEILVGPPLTHMIEQLLNTPSTERQLRLVEEFLIVTARSVRKKRIYAEDVVRFLSACHGKATVGEVAQQFKCSTRLIELKFRDQVGISPKYLARTFQFNHLLSLLRQSRSLSWTRLAHEAGYYDQAHLIKAFLTFTGESPVQYDEGDHLLTQTHLDKEMITYREG